MTLTKRKYMQCKQRMERVTKDKWDIKDCIYADRYIKACAIKELRRKLRMYHIPKRIAAYITMMCDFHFGCVETNDFLTQLKCYDKTLIINSIKD